MLDGSINHVSITVTDLRKAMEAFGPFLQLLGYTLGEILQCLKLEVVHMPEAEKRFRELRHPAVARS